jgi:hypothetical protein
MSIDDSIDRYTWSQSFNPFIAPAVAQPPFLHPQLPAHAAAPAARPILNVVLPAFRATRPAAWVGAEQGAQGPQQAGGPLPSGSAWFVPNTRQQPQQPMRSSGSAFGQAPQPFPVGSQSPLPMR